MNMILLNQNKLIKTAANIILTPLGCKQKGASRIWFDTHKFWVAFIEFQPHSLKKGSFLNVGACWLWYESEYISFDEGYRIKEFKDFKDINQSQDIALGLAIEAREELLKLRLRFSSLEKIALHLKSKDFTDIWINYHAAIAAVLTHDLLHANSRFLAIEKYPKEFPWAIELKKRANFLAEISTDSIKFEQAINKILENSKRLKKLYI